MADFEYKLNHFFRELQDGKPMVLSTALRDKVTSRMMSVVLQDGLFYFQTSCHSRKYYQLKSNQNISLCVDNIQIEGIAEESGKPTDSEVFKKLFKYRYPDAFAAYTSLKNERLFSVRPIHIQRWLYINGTPQIEIFDLINKTYCVETVND